LNYLEEYIERLEEISARYGVSLIFLFGSRNDTGIAYLEGKAIEEQDPMADLDIGVVFQRGKFPAKPYKVYAQLYADLSVLFDPFKLDLVFLQETHSLIQFEAIKGNCIFATTAQAKIDYIEDVLRRGADWKPVMDKFYQELAEITGVG
jgi:predicted nucleotidyltransferase